jgi:cell wall-associated NlpC family hydrolase
VVRRTLDAALADDALAVAYRSPKMDSTIASRVVGFAVSQLGKPYSVKGAALSADKILCRLVGPLPASFFCSQLVFESYRRAGMPLTNSPSQCVTPGDAVVIAEKSLSYVGHLLGDPAWLPVVSP